ncbi:hypothetical protein RND81_02G219900 [Saponaria officinalis]|uniref:Uncharacterized protein n=1 Tax=Saponaria officinalis TaxID=3572 RepID=A0AAW1MWV9_SAPOF
MAKFEKSIICTFVVVLSLTFVALGSNITSFGPIQGFELVLQWYGSYCNQEDVECCYPTTGKPTPNFTIYGFWPHDGNNRYPSECGGGGSVVPIKSLEGRLQQAWPSFYCDEPARELWLDQWRIRGTCCVSLFNETVYFENAINLQNKIDVLQVFSRVGITPNNRFYPLGVIRKVVTSAFGHEPIVTCTENKKGQSQIWRIVVCVDKSGTNFVKCQFTLPKSDCQSNVLFPTYYTS